MNMILLGILVWCLIGCKNDNIVLNEFPADTANTTRNVTRSEGIDSKTKNKQKRLDKTENKKIYTYKNSFRNPFQKNQKINFKNKKEKSKIKNEKDSREGISNKERVKKIKSIIPFKLKGIIYIKPEPMALIETSDSLKMVKTDDFIESYQIFQINKNSIIVEYKKLKIDLELEVN